MKSYLEIGVDNNVKLTELQNQIGEILSKYYPHITPVKEDNMHFTICYLGKKTTEQLDEFNTIYCRNLNSIDPAVSIDKILFRKSFVEGDGYIISLSVGSDRVYNLYKQFEIKAWKKEGHQDKEFTPHITMYKIPGVSELNDICKKEIGALLNQPIIVQCKDSNLIIK